MKDKYWVIIPAAGVGSRFKGEQPKQYRLLHGKTVLEHSIALFLCQAWVEKFIVLVSADDLYFAQLPIANNAKIHVVFGGETRMHSVMNGIAYLQQQAKAQDWVLVHDAVRPCLSQSDLDCLRMKLTDDLVGGILATPVQDTLKLVLNQKIEKTLERETLWQAGTPQMFRLTLLAQALQHCLSHGINVTDDASALEFCGHAVSIVEAKDPNPKLTYSRDCVLISLLLSQDRKD